MGPRRYRRDPKPLRTRNFSEIFLKFLCCIAVHIAYSALQECSWSSLDPAVLIRECVMLSKCFGDVPW